MMVNSCLTKAHDETAQTHVFMASHSFLPKHWTMLKLLLAIMPSQHCHVHFYAFVGKPLWCKHDWKFSFCDLWSWMDIFYPFFTCVKHHQHKTSNLFLPLFSFPGREMNFFSHCIDTTILLYERIALFSHSTVACFHFLFWGSNRWQPLLFDNWANKRIQYTLKLCTKNCCCLRLFSFAWTWVHVGESCKNTFRFLGCDIFFP